VQRAAVLDFEVGTGLDPILGRKAADALAVELTRSGDYEVVTRQELEQAVASQPGLRPPYTAPTQARLAGVVNARSVFSGRVIRTIVSNNRSARVLIEVRQLDVITSDYVNGTQINEVTDEKLQQFDNDVLVDESINKAAFAAVRSMKQTTLPTGTVLNVTNENIELNIGTRNGAAPGQRYSVLRDNLNRARNIVERIKVGEVTITSVEDNQSTSRVTGGGQAGVRTGDKVRQIFVPSNFPISSTSTSSTPVSAPPPSNRRGKSFLGKAGQTVLGVAALVGLVALGGFGGGSNNTPNEAPSSVIARPIRTSLTTTDATTGTTTGGAAIQLNFRDGLPGIIRGQGVAGYLIFRSTSANFSASNTTLIDFSRGQQTTYVDDTSVAATRNIAITGGTSTTTTAPVLTITETVGTGTNAFTQTATGITIVVTKPAIQNGVQYFYRVARVVATTTTTTNTGNNTNTTTTTLQPVLSQVSPVSGGATAIPTLLIDPATAPTTLTQFAVRLPVTFVGGNIDQARLEVSVSQSFPANNTFVQTFAAPVATGGVLTINAGNIIVPNYDPNSGSPIYVRVGLSASSDVPGGVVYSNPLALNGVTTSQSALVGGRFLSPTGAGRRRGGLGTSGSTGSATGRTRGSGRAGGFILRPR
jgi:hypothetical protein